ncbi:hypothetical protein HY480_03435, partial [Candidatus Uhrbacteria bacterium]|nr:hypothetical protein [Candidatus Uhrbacteria bacterium]
ALTDAYRTDAPRRYLKVAPPELRCDSPVVGNRSSTCGAFAQSCSQEDVGCDRFTPLDGSPLVVGQYANADRCPAECVGYSTFREDESDFDVRSDADFFLPSTARACTSAEVGCSEFTNLDALSAGGESREYFTELRQCKKPSDPTAIPATFYVWEGSETQGYQLQSFRLQAEGTGAGAPPMAVNDLRLGGDQKDCTRYYAQSPLLPTGAVNPDYDSSFTPDCRAFYSQNGAIAYRLLTRTILITDDCIPYRLSHALDETTCEETKGGTFENGACVFHGHRPESTQCSAAVNGCREYRGNTGGALQTLLAADFDRVDANGSYAPGWSSGAITSESLVVGGHSLSIASGGSSAYVLRDAEESLTEQQCRDRGGTYVAAASGQPAHCTFRRYLKSGGTYELLLVGKGTGLLTAAIEDGSTRLVFKPEQHAFGLSWRRVVFGPLIIPLEPALTDNAALTLSVAGGTAYIDQLLLREIPTTTSVIKRSWVTPISCDRASMDNNAAPQAQGMLGCRAYRDRAGLTVNLRSFARLCASDAIGCTAFYDTRGNAERTTQYFQSGGDNRDNVTVPPDGVRYLVDDPTKACVATVKSCRRFGLPTLDRSGDTRDGVPTDAWTDLFLRDDPERYEGAGATLCKNEHLFCEEYAGKDGTLAYFKNPGNRTCEFQERVEVASGLVATGWFRKGSTTACDSSYVIRSAEYGIRSNADTAYAGWTGTCKPEFDRCTELRDPTDTSTAYPNGRPYHVIKDETLDLASCAGQVSRKEGCALLADASVTNASWSAAVSYANVDANRGQLLPPVDCGRDATGCKRCGIPRKCSSATGTLQTPLAPSETCTVDAQCDTNRGFTCRGGELTTTTCTNNAGCTAPQECLTQQNDANVILKVQRGRACSQWLSRDGCIESFDEQANQWKQVCTRLRHETSDRAAPDTVATAARLTVKAYQSRDPRWSGSDVSGYSVPDLPSLNALEQVRESPAVAPYLAYVRCRPGIDTGCGTIEGSCTVGAGDECGAALPEFGGQRGKCYGGRCAYKVAGASWRCRVFPEQTSPFPPNVRDQTGDATQRLPQFPAANVCEGATDCSCDYQKVTFESGTSKYLASRAPTPLGICVGGDHDGKSCTPGAVGVRDDVSIARASCNGVASDDENASSRNGTCSGVKEKLEVRGMEGYCVEEDSSLAINGEPDRYACRTFLPIDHVSGSVDVTNVVKGAGAIELALERNSIQWYCSEGFADPESEKTVRLRLLRSINMDAWAPQFKASGFLVDQTGATKQSFLAPKEFEQPPGNFRRKLNPITKDGDPIPVTFQSVKFSHVGGEDCNEKDSGWCMWPADTHRGGWDPGTCQNADKMSCRYNGGTVNGPAINLFGCYELHEDAPSILYYPWNETGMGPVYDWQLESITVRMPSDSETNKMCNTNTREDSSAMFQDLKDTERTAYVRPDPDYANGKIWWGQFIQRTGEDGGGAAFHAIFGEDGKLLGMVVEAYSNHSDGSFFIHQLDLNYKQGCRGTVRVVDPTAPDLASRLYPKTNAMWSRSQVPGALGPYRTSTQCIPWGGIQPYRSGLNAVVGSTSGPYNRQESDTYIVETERQACTADTAALYQPAQLQQLFAKTFDVLRTPLDEIADIGTVEVILRYPPRYRRESPSNVAASAWDSRPSGTPPTVLGVGTCTGSGQKCQEDDRLTGTISVNTQNSGDVTGAGGILPVNIKFFAYADKDQMPIKDIAVSWGNGTPAYSATGGPYGNRRGYHGETSLCDDSTFGQSKEACRPRPVTITYVYECAENPSSVPQSSLCKGTND